jgi:type II restriction enzyme
MILESRADFSSSEEFKDAFLETLTPGIIPRKDFIHWESISKKVDLYKKYFEFFRNLQTKTETSLVTELRDALLSDDAPYNLIKTAFELLGHTGKVFVSVEDYIDLKSFGEISANEENMEYISNLLVSLGLQHALNTEIEDYFLGVQVGLETHRRKNVGGKAFIDIVRIELEKIVVDLKSKGNNWDLKEEQPILYLDGDTSKRVDFLLEKGDKKIGVEVNFYTASGSKPTEIKRSYTQVNRDLDAVGASLIWVTDGVGYLSMKRSLKEARDSHQNIYNLKMLQTHLETDLSQI